MTVKHPEIPENINEVTYYNRDQSPVEWATVGECREFMRRIVEEDWVWAKLYDSGWGGHWHRAVLAIALSEGADKDVVNFVPFMLREIYSDKSTTHFAEDMPENRARSFLREIDSQREAEDFESVLEIERRQGYHGQGKRPAWLPGLFEGLRREYLDDKYNYWRNGLTGERLEPRRFNEEPAFDD
ncbi:MAG: hypothetical protein U0520_04470 [Candidatus Saccharimonadales bacterium]